MAVYDKNQMNRMRQDAIRRSQEMHRRSTVNTAHYSQGDQHQPDLPPNYKEIENAEAQGRELETAARNPGNRVTKKNQLPDMLGKLLNGSIDSDKLIIIALMIILAREGADMKLILALGYILL